MLVHMCVPSLFRQCSVWWSYRHECCNSRGTLVTYLHGVAIGPWVQVEGITIDAEGLGFLGELSETTSLRHAVQLLTPAMTLTRTNGRDSVTRADLEEVAELFHDAKYSARLLADQADKYIQ